VSAVLPAAAAGEARCVHRRALEAIGRIAGPLQAMRPAARHDVSTAEGGSGDGGNEGYGDANAGVRWHTHAPRNTNIACAAAADRRADVGCTCGRRVADDAPRTDPIIVSTMPP
jgi:hypothetical protein